MPSVKVFFLVLCSLCYLYACSKSPLKQAYLEQKIKLDFAPKEIILAQGHVFLFRLSIPEKIRPEKFNCNGTFLPWWINGGSFYALISAQMDAPVQQYGCVLKYSVSGAYSPSQYEDHVLTVKVNSYAWQEEKLHVIKKLQPQSPQEIARIEREWLHMRDVVYAKTNPKPYFEHSFQKPLNSAITSAFGRKRLYNNVKKNQHNGIDFRAKTGTPIRATNAGKVVFVGNLFYGGNTVIIDHGVGIYSNYAHLSAFKVVEGEFIPQGGVIGLAGMTGRVTGPHLHWGVKVNGTHIDGLSLVDITI